MRSRLCFRFFGVAPPKNEKRAVLCEKGAYCELADSLSSLLDNPRISQHARRFSFFFVRVPTLFLAGRSFFLFASRCASRSFFLLAPRCAARHTRPQAKARSLSRAIPARKQKHARSALASAHTDDRRTDEATCGPQAWLTGSLHGGGIRSARSPLRRAPLLATPIAKPLQCDRP